MGVQVTNKCWIVSRNVRNIFFHLLPSLKKKLVFLKKCARQMPHICFHTHIAYSRTCAQLVYLKRPTPFEHLASLCVSLPPGILTSGAPANPEGTAGSGVGSTGQLFGQACWGRHDHFASDNLGSARLAVQRGCVLLQHRCSAFKSQGNFHDKDRPRFCEFERRHVWTSSRMWSPALTLSEVLLSTSSELTDPEPV